MTWAVIDLSSEDRGVHVVPCKEDGTPLEPHQPDLQCSCHPKWEDNLTIHNEVH